METTNDTKNASGPRYADGKFDADGYIAPTWGPIDRIPVPHDGVHEVNETTECCPDHVGACRDGPMPCQRDDGKDERGSGES